MKQNFKTGINTQMFEISGSILKISFLENYHFQIMRSLLFFLFFYLSTHNNIILPFEVYDIVIDFFFPR